MSVQQVIASAILVGLGLGRLLVWVIGRLAYWSADRQCRREDLAAKPPSPPDRIGCSCCGAYSPAHANFCRMCGSGVNPTPPKWTRETWMDMTERAPERKAPPGTRLSYVTTKAIEEGVWEHTYYFAHDEPTRNSETLGFWRAGETAIISDADWRLNPSAARGG